MEINLGTRITLHYQFFKLELLINCKHRIKDRCSCYTLYKGEFSTKPL